MHEFVPLPLSFQHDFNYITDRTSATDVASNHVGDGLDFQCRIADGEGRAGAMKHRQVRQIIANHGDTFTRNVGGRGAVRDVVEVVLKAQGKWDDLVQGFA